MAAVNLALVLVPTLLMGATLPLLVSHLVRRSGNVGSAVGLLYYVNTLGAGAACLVCTLLLFPFLGMQGAVYVAVAINVAVAAGALVAHWCDARCGRAPRRRMRRHRAARAAALGFAPVLALAGAGGFVSLSYEIFFFRTVSYASGSSATAFAATLSAFLVGLASGSRQAGEHCETLVAREVMRRAVRGLMTANLLGLLFLPLLDHLAWLDRGIIGVAMLMVYLVARFWGALLPYLAELGVAADGQAGMRTALLYLANILGAAAGSILTGFVLMDRLGLDRHRRSRWWSRACSAPSCWSRCSTCRRGSKLARAGIAAALARARACSRCRAGRRTCSKACNGRASPSAKPFVHVVENRSGIITVDADGTVFGHGMYDGHFNTDLKHDTNGIVRPYALSLFHPAPRDVLMIGLVLGLLGAGHRQQSRSRLAHRSSRSIPAT